MVFDLDESGPLFIVSRGNVRRLLRGFIVGASCLLFKDSVNILTSVSLSVRSIYDKSFYLTINLLMLDIQVAYLDGRY